MHSPYRFFKNKPERPKARNSSRSPSNLSSHTNSKPKQLPHVLPSKAEQELRKAIEGRYHKSKMRQYSFANARLPPPSLSRSSRSSHSSQMEEFEHLKVMQRVDLKEYHLGQQKGRANSKDKKPLHLRIKLKEGGLGSQRSEESPQQHSNPYLLKLPKNLTPTKIAPNNEAFNFISIQLKNKHKPFTNRPQTRQEQNRSHERGFYQRGNFNPKTGGSRHTKSNEVRQSSREDKVRSSKGLEKAVVPRLGLGKLEKYNF